MKNVSGDLHLSRAPERTGNVADPVPVAAPAGRRRLITACVLALVIVSALAVRLSNPELQIDELTYMSRVLESMAQGSVLPVQGSGDLFMNKPPLAFWLMRLSFQVLGPSPFAARLPSVLAAAATALLLYAFGSARFGERVGILAALVFALTPGLVALHGIRSATTDALEILLVTSAIVALESWRRRRRPWTLACMVILVGATAWVKSPFGVIVFLAILLATERPARRAGQGTPRFGFTVAWVAGVWLGLYLLWLGTLSFATSARVVTNRLLVRQYAHRLEGRISAYHVQGPGYYAITVARDFGPLLLLPACLFALKVFASRRGWKSPRYEARYEVALLVVWALAAPVLGTASISKRPWYAYLSYPGIALLLAVSGDRLARAVSGRRSVQAALLAAIPLIHAGRIPAGSVWPAEGRYRGLAGRLWEVADHDSRIRVVPGPGFQLPRQYDIEYREARLFVRLLFWRSSRDRPEPGSCRATLVRSLQDVPEGLDALELQPATRRDAALFLIDDCGGKVREQVSRR
ncbi:MAG TPA: glycosyltransferase family 39 protein [Thermoanaerobaculia bacterium]|nr:glycosyltransferase family 39 protein [Thermoanaerobaculia bacterium]